MEKTAKEKRKVMMPGSLRNKLTAALCMLLVSTIMMVSSTYAWFTLSTAPEVTNITTTVAGNGSLEIALMPNNGLVGSIQKGGSSVANASVLKTVANINWGNIVELAGNYGLEEIKLQPAVLDTENLDGLLQTAVFGMDGRVASLEANTGWAKYDAGTGDDAVFVKIGDDENAYGVRAIATGTDTAGAEITPYGYVVDLAFRINTENDDGTPAKLMLSDALQRIDGSNNAKTMGGGSNMTVTLGEGVTLETARRMLNAIQVTFVQDFGKTGTGLTPTVLATGKLDTGSMSLIADGTYTVPLHLYKLVTYTGTYEDTGKPWTRTVWESITDDVLTTLQKNQAVQISAIVWMDGNELKNDAFAIDGNTLTGSLNLQFTTDVTLTPAKDAELFQTTRSQTTTTTPTNPAPAENEENPDTPETPEEPGTETEP